MLDEDAARALVEASKTGTKVLITGPRGGRLVRPRHAVAPGAGRPRRGPAGGAPRDDRPGAPRPAQAQWVTFENLAQHWLRRGTKASPAALTGNVWHEPLPLDFARETEPLDALLAAALKAAGVPTHPAGDGVAARVLVAPKSVLVVCVNETPSAARRRVVRGGTAGRYPGRGLPLPAGAVREGHREGARGDAGRRDRALSAHDDERLMDRGPVMRNGARRRNCGDASGGSMRTCVAGAGDVALARWRGRGPRRRRRAG